MHMNKPPYTLFWLPIFTTLHFLFTCCISFILAGVKVKGCHQITAFGVQCEAEEMDNIILFSLGSFTSRGLMWREAIWYSSWTVSHQMRYQAANKNLHSASDSLSISDFPQSSETLRDK